MTISASPETVWDVLVDPVYAPKMHQDMLTMVVNPIGKGAKGQRRCAVVRAGRTKLEICGVVTEAARPNTFVLHEEPGGLFTKYTEAFQVTKAMTGSEVRANFEYEISKEYVHGTLNIARLENGIAESLRNFLKNLKDIAELKPIGEAVQAQQPA